MTSKFYLRFLQIGAIASLLTVFFVFPDLLFPYITSKQLTFNILMEFLLLVWGVFIWKFPVYRPKWSYITWGLLAFIVGITASCFVSTDLVTSFWGDAERMLGIFHVLHFVILYLILITVFKTEEDWKILFYTSIVIASLVSIKAITGNPYSTIGNTAYVSGYLIFNLYFTILLFFKEKNKDSRWLLALPAALMLWSFARAHTSGAIIGLGISVLFIIFLIGVLSESRRKKAITWSSLAVAILALVLIFSQQQATWFQNSFLKNLTSQKTTFQTRLVSWQAAAKDFHNHPWLGVGFGNYAVVFDRYFDAKFYNYSRGETYFDRAHNNLIDIASTAGIVGLVSYLSIFVAVLFYLLRLIKKEAKSLEALILFGLFLAYFIQNLAVFDSLVTYIGLMISLAYVYYLSQEQTEKEKVLEKEIPEFSALTTGLIIFLLLTSYCNIRPWHIFQATISSYSLLASGNIAEGFKSYQETFTMKHPLDRDSKSALINSLISAPNMASSLGQEEGLAFVDYVISLAEENRDHNKQDSLMALQVAQTYSVAINTGLVTSESKYLEKTLEALDASIALSPQRIPVYIMKSSVLASVKKYDEAVAVLQLAAALNKDFPDAYCQLYRTYYIDNQTTLAWQNADSCIDLNGAENMQITKDFLSLLDHYYQAHDWPRAIKMAKRVVSAQGASAQAWALLADIYQQSGDNINSEEAFKQAMLLNYTGSSSTLENKK